MAAGPGTLGSSLPVPRVQALAASLDGTSEIPDRYVRTEVKTGPVVVDDAGLELPVVDLRRAQLSREECAKMGLACEEWGFFQLINHGVPLELMEKMRVDVTEFFKLPMEEKEAFAQLPDGPDSLQGYGQLFVKSEEQKLDWGDALVLYLRPASRRDMRFWPTYPPTFRETLDAYTSALKDIACCLLRLMAVNLGLEPEILMNNFKEMQQTARINYYPPCPKAEKVIGLSPHSDATGLTILYQASDVHGLQIRNSDKWFSVRPLRGAFIVNIGDILEIFTNGKYKSIEHRAIVNTERDRLSIATFHAPNHDCMLRPFPQLVDGGVEKYKTSSWVDYMKAYFSAKLDGKNHLESVKLKNCK